ncbi:MAG: sugar transferase [Patescibacteria group bacterium]|nr:sugar transferase [Patescibacteria group bacterium]
MTDTIVKVKKALLVLGDLAAAYSSLYLTLLLRYRDGLNLEAWQSHLVPFTAIYLAWIVVFFISDLYNLNTARNTVDFRRRFFQALAINALIAVAFFYLNPAVAIAPKTNLIINIAVFAILAYFWRAIFNLAASHSIFANRVLFIGSQKKFQDIMPDLARGAYHDWKVVAVVDPQEIKEYRRDNVSFYKNTTPLSEIINQEKISTIVLGLSPEEHPRLGRELYDCIFAHSIAVVNLPKFYEIVTQRLPADLLSEYWFLENIKEMDKKFHDSAKAIADIALSIAFGAFFLATLPIIAAATLIDSGWPIFYTQNRVGRRGKIFKIIKYRTMYRDAELQGALWAKRNDARITRVGRLLRKTRLDELPQIINVLKTDMSFIGPRPERPEFVADLERMMPFYALRHLTRPGLTGWAQINYEYAASYEENLKKLQYDLYYIKNRSLLLDFKILLKTAGIVISRKGQ